MSTTELTQKARGGLELPLRRLASAASRVRITRRTLQVVLGLFWVIDGALQVHGGMGFMREAEIERLYRDCRILRIFEGTSDIQLLTIARRLLQRFDDTGDTRT